MILFPVFQINNVQYMPFTNNEYSDIFKRLIKKIGLKKIKRIASRPPEYIVRL